MKMKLTRRHTLTLALSAALAPLSNMAAHAQDQSKPEFIVVNASGGEDEVILREAYWNDFERDHGIKVIVDAPENFGKMRAMVESGNVTWALANLDSNDALRASRMNLLEEIDPAIVDRSEFLEGYNDPYAFANSIYSVVFAYHKDAFPDGGIKSWADFWDVEKFPGKRGLRKGAKYALEFALMADGVAPADVYKTLGTPEGVDRAFKKLDEIKPHMVWWEAGAQPLQLLSSGEVVMTSAYNGRITGINRSEGKNFGFVFPESIYAIDSWVILKNSPNKDAAMDFIAFSSKPENQAKLPEYIAYGLPNLEAAKQVDAKYQAELPTTPANLENAIPLDIDFWTDNSEELTQRFNAWLAQ